jgi:hypothetical protein
MEVRYAALSEATWTYLAGPETSTLKGRPGPRAIAIAANKATRRITGWRLGVC